MVRKLGGFTFQELNLTIDDIRQIGEVGADLSYDFINRPAYHHALVTADTEFLRLTLRATLELGVDPASLVHALQNHDELTYELVHWSTGHRDDVYTYKGESVTGEALGEAIRSDLTERLTGESRPYNLVFTTNGIACTTATVIAAALGSGGPGFDRGRRTDPKGALAAGHVQCTAAGRLCVVGVGSVRHADPASGRCRSASAGW